MFFMQEGRRKPWLKLLVFTSCFGVLSACAGPKQAVVSQRRVSEGERHFSSSANPRVKIAVPSEWDFLGEIEEHEFDAGVGVPVEALSYLWGEIQEKKLSEGFLVRILTIPASEDFLWDPQIFSGVSRKLDAGTIEIEERSYEYVTTVFPDPLADYEERFVTSAGHTIPHFFLVKALGQLDSTKKVKSYLLYFNHIDPARFNGFLKKFLSDEWDETNLNEQEEELLQDFFERFQQDIQFLPFKK